MRDDRTRKRSLINKAKKGKIREDDFIGKIKYHYSQEDREYILKKLPSKYSLFAYNNPLPKNETQICQIEGIWSNQSSIAFELKWCLEVLAKFTAEINKFLDLKNEIEKSVLEKKTNQTYNLLDTLQEKVCCSFYSLQTEFYLNEITGNGEESKEIIKEFPYEETPPKLLVLLEFARIKIDHKVSFWQYDSVLEEHKKQYSKDSKNLLDYIDFKLNPIHHDEKLSELEFLVFFDSNFSIIDRYNSIKNVLPIILFENHLSEEETLEIIEKIKSLSAKFEDTYWNKLLLLLDNSYSDLQIDIKTSEYLEIQDQYFESKYLEVIRRCNRIFQNHPNFSDLYIFYTKSLIFLDKAPDEVLDKESELYEIISLIYQILLKDDQYYSARDKLLDKYYLLSHFDFSTPLLEFLYNEFRLEIPQNVKRIAYLKSSSFRYNSFALFGQYEEFVQLKVSKTSKAIEAVKQYLKEDIAKGVDYSSFFDFKLKIGCLIYQNHIDSAVQELTSYYERFKTLMESNKFIQTWLDKTLLKCYFKKNDLQKVSDLIVQVYFKNRIAYDHFYDEKLINSFNNIEVGENLFDNISTPILFEIYNQPQSSIYDRIADFLIANNIHLPSEIPAHLDKFPDKMLIHFLEFVCTKDNIQDSPFLNSIESLESERINILNLLKSINEDKTEIYNSEILEITKQSSLRRGLLQIHESRIYVDINNIEKHLAKELPEIFERYLSFDDISYSAISSMTLKDKRSKESFLISFYMLEPIDEELLPLYTNRIIDPRTDPNVVVVPAIRYTYFHSMFDTIKQEFVYNEDYGFKSFLSMRIRHGTFTNVLRSVFDKHNLIGSRASDSKDYQNIEFWRFENEILENEIQSLLKDFSNDIDSLIDKALSWINVKSSNDQDHIFDFDITTDKMYSLYHNRFGRIKDYGSFVNETFEVLYDRLDICLNHLKSKISKELIESLLAKIDILQKSVDELAKKNSGLTTIQQSLVSCKTDLQLIINQIVKWFNVSKNQYIEEFPIDMIIQNSLDYINSIYTDSIHNAKVDIENTCSSNFKGKYFESFGDMLINIFDNIVSKNRDLGSRLKINIQAKEEENQVSFKICNNLSNSVNKKQLKERVSKINQNVLDYKKEGMASSFEEGSGFLKICKCISVDLERNDYIVEPRIDKNTFEVDISFNTKNLTV